MYVLPVYRLEHTACPTGKHGHGPFKKLCSSEQTPMYASEKVEGPITQWDYEYRLGDTYRPTIEYPATPNFGTSGYPPVDIKPTEFCGVLKDQLPFWWGGTNEYWTSLHFSSEAVANYIKHNWFFVLYLVKPNGARITRGQVVFRRKYVVFQTVVAWDAIIELSKDLNGFNYDRVESWHDKQPLELDTSKHAVPLDSVASVL